MPLYILDTDHVSLYQRGHPLVREYVLSLPFGNVVTTIVTVEEQLRGRLNAIRRSSDGPALIAAYERIQATLRAAFLLREVFDYDYSTLASMLGKSEVACRQL